jgi:hypothetical protein
MLAPRAAHVCITLRDGSVLVAGGFSGPGGPTNSAEIFHTDSNAWSTTGAMLTARTHAAAVALPNGSVLVAGGESSGEIANTLELYDPAEGRFHMARGILSSPRSNHAMAILSDGRVLIAGGSDGTRILDTIDIFDPTTEEIRSAGFLLEHRSELSATTLADGRVLFTGGFDGEQALASAEIYDPATGISTALPPMSTPRRGHVAIRPPNGENVVVAEGIGTVRGGSRAELFVAGRNGFVPAQDVTGTETSGPTVTVAQIDSMGKPRNVRVYRVSSGR